MMPIRLFCLTVLLVTGSAPVLSADEAQVPKGVRVLSTGNSFHFYVPSMLKEMARQAGIQGHVLVDYQGIGGSRVIQHWDLPDDQNKAKKALLNGKVDVMTMNPIFLPDEGIGNYVKMGLENNPKMLFTVQQSWLIRDQIGTPDNEPLYAKRNYTAVDRNARTGEEVRKEHDAHFKAFDAHVRELNKQVGKAAVFIVPCGQAAILLRDKIIARQAFDLTSQDALFLDEMCHPSPILQTLASWLATFAVIYRKSPVGQPVPRELASPKLPNEEKVNRLLQDLAWQAVTEHPLSGMHQEKKGK